MKTSSNKYQIVKEDILYQIQDTESMNYVVFGNEIKFVTNTNFGFEKLCDAVKVSELFIEWSNA
jgi:hypothetical protein